MSNLTAAALAYARHGVAVLPLQHNGKRPLTEHGVKDATAGPLALERLFAGPCNLGLAIPAEWVVLDVDVRNDGPATLRGWLAKWGQLPVTPHQTTASGGDHFIFRRPTHTPNLRTKLGPGVELLGVGRYIVAAPSRIGEGQYRWDVRLSTTKIADLPLWLLDLACYPVEAPSSGQTTGAARPDVVDRAWKYLDTVPPAISGSGGHAHTFLTAQKLVRGFDLDDQTAFILLDHWNQNCQPRWSQHELRRKIEQARAKGTIAFGSLRDQQRRAREGRHGFVVEGTIVIATTQAEEKAAIAALRQLAEELPP